MAEAKVPAASADPTNPAPPPGQMRHGFVRNAAWVVTGSILTKLATLGAQILLGHLLLQEDVGLVSVALSVNVSLLLLTFQFMGEVLILQQKRWDELASQVYWMTFTWGCITGCLMYFFAPLLSQGDPRLVPLLRILALSHPLAALQTIYGARLRIDLRFRVVSLIVVLQGTVQLVGTLVLAWMGAGAYALIIPIVPRTLIAYIVNRIAVGRLKIDPPKPSVWPGLLAPSAWMILTNVLSMFELQGIPYILGFFMMKDEVGVYSWGATLALQAIVVLATNLKQLITATMTKIADDAARQLIAVKRLWTVLYAVLGPTLILQALTAESITRAVLPERWYASIPVIAILSIGLLGFPASLVGKSTYQARGMLKMMSAMALFRGIITVGLVVIACSMDGDPRLVSCFVAGAYLFNGLLDMYVTSRLFGHRMDRIAAGPIRPLLVSVLLGAAVWSLDRAIEAWNPFLRFGVVCLVYGVGYLAVLRFLLPSLWTEVLESLPLPQGLKQRFAIR